MTYNGPRLQIWGNWALPVLLGILGALVLVWVWGPVSCQLGPAQIGVSVNPLGSGWTEVMIPPAGTVGARTHSGPLDLKVSLERIDVEAVGDLVLLDAEDRAFREVADDLPRTLRSLTLTLLLLGALGGALGSRLFGYRQPPRLLAAALAGTLAVGALLLITAGTYDVTAFDSPRYTGIMTAAPGLLEILSGVALEMGGLEERLDRIGENLGRLLGGLEALDPLPEEGGRRRILVVADLHNNPVGVSLVTSLVRTFGVDMVLDAGDVTDWGTALEAELVSGIGQMGIPYVIALGNHDSPVIREQLDPYPDVHFLMGDTLTIDGIPILGYPDPAARGHSPTIPDKAQLEDQVHQLELGLARSPQGPLLIMAHHPEVSRRFLGRVPVVIAGHTHRVQVSQEGGSLYLNPGSTGASGIRGLDQMAGDEYSALLLHLSDQEGESDPRVKAVDIITFSPENRSMRLERRNLEPPGVDPGGSGGE